MVYAAIGLVLLGTLLGFRFRYRVLLPFILLVLLVSIFVVFRQQLGLLESVLLMAIGQAIMQGSYFIGLAVRPLLHAAHRKLPVPAKGPAQSASDQRPPIGPSHGIHRT